MRRRTNLRLIYGGVAAALLIAAPAAAQEPQAPQPSEEAAPAVPEDPAAIQQQLLEIQQRLALAEQKVMADPEIQAMQTKLQARVEEEVKKIDPKFDDKVERLTQIQASVLEAQQANDDEKVQALLTEGQALQQELEVAQNKAIEEKAVAAQIEEFQKKVHAKMVEIEPETEALVKRANVLVTKLQGES